ncbi:MAG: hypothetical protein M1508_08620 [Nitrospirae bacterium]|nr:hypothetical protein [Nitrospirota bacterium]MCL5421585.1 hypothetical protein [Nitrospirota bacterium]
MKKVLMLFVIVLMFTFWVSQSLAAGTQEASSVSGKVVETMDSGRYTYALLEKNRQKTWVAVPQMKITRGQHISFQPGIEMTNFESKGLKRTFDRIIFSAGPVK